MLLEFTKGDILLPKDKEGQQQKQEREQQQQQKQQQQQQTTQLNQAEQKLLERLIVFKECYSQKITKFNCSSVTGQYRFRGVVGIIVTIVALLVNGFFYSALNTGFTQCHLDGNVAFSIKHRFFQCTRSMGSYFKVGSILLFVLLGLHLFFVFYSFVWSLIGERWGPVYKITSEKSASPSEQQLPAIELTSLTQDNDAAEEGTLLTYNGDAAFLFHFIHKSNYSFLITVIRYLLEEQEKERRL